MKKLICLLMAAVMALGLFGLSAAEEAAAAESPIAYIMYADGSWTNQYWYDGNEYPVTAKTAEVTGAGDYTVGLEFQSEASGLAFAALGIKGGETAFPNYTIELKAIRVNGEAIAFTKGYTSSDDGLETRMNIYNEWVTDVPADARSFDGSLEGAAPIIVDKALFDAVKSVEIDFTLVPVTDLAYLMYANGDWSTQFWYDGNEYPVTAKTAEITGEGTYTVGLEFPAASDGLAFAAVGIVNGEKTFPGYFIDITDIKVNGEAIEVRKGYTSSDDGITTRENIYNEWVAELPADARRKDEDLEGAAPIIVDKEAFTAVTSVEVTFNFIYGVAPEKPADAPMTAEEAKAIIDGGFNAYIACQTDIYVFRNAWNDNYGLNDTEHPYFGQLTGWDNPDTDDGSYNLGGTFVDAEIKDAGEYTVSLTTGETGFGTPAGAASKTFNLLFVSTNIPSKLYTDGFVTISDVKTTIGTAAAKDYFEVDTSGEYVMIKILDSYNQSSEPFGYTMPGAGESISISFTVAYPTAE